MIVRGLLGGAMPAAGRACMALGSEVWASLVFCRSRCLPRPPCFLLLLLLCRCSAVLATGPCSFELCLRCGGGIGGAVAVSAPLRCCAPCTSAGAFDVVAGRWSFFPVHLWCLVWLQ